MQRLQGGGKHPGKVLANAARPIQDELALATGSMGMIRDVSGKLHFEFRVGSC